MCSGWTCLRTHSCLCHLFCPHCQSESELSPRQARARKERLELNSELRHVQMLRSELEIQLDKVPEVRSKRIAQKTELVESEKRVASEKMQQTALAHQHEVELLQRQFELERFQHKATFEAREVDFKRSLKSFKSRETDAAIKAEAETVRATRAEAKAAAATDVLAEAQAEAQQLRLELTRTRMQLQCALAGTQMKREPVTKGMVKSMVTPRAQRSAAAPKLGMSARAQIAGASRVAPIAGAMVSGAVTPEP